MPIYEYKCESCETCFERLVFAGDDEKVDCPDCGSRKVAKLMSCASFIGDSTAGLCSSGSSSRFS